MQEFLKCVAEAVLENGIKGLAQMVPGGEFAFSVAESAIKKYRMKKKEHKLREDILATANLKFEDAKEQAVAVVREVMAELPVPASPQSEPPPTDDDIITLQHYISAIPESIRQSFKRPEDPSGTTAPADFQVKSVDDMVKLLPARPPQFRVGDPVPGKPGWIVERLLGIGGFGEVWFTKHQRMATLNGAIKFCLGKTARDLIHEADLIDRVMQVGSHPNIVPLKDVHLEGTTPWLMFEYIGGGNLTDWMHSLAAKTQEQRIPQVLAAIRQLTDAVAHFHSLARPIVHRDLKPSNILLDRKSRKLRITDFGIGSVTACELNRQERSGQSTRGGRLLSYLRGSHTPLYSSPQQRRGDDPDPRDDVHALGVIAYQMLTGKLDSGPGPAAARVLKTLGVADELAELILDCTSEELDYRPRNGQDLAERVAKLNRAVNQDRPVRAAHQNNQAAVPKLSKSDTPPQQISYSINVPGTLFSKPQSDPDTDWSEVEATPITLEVETGQWYCLVLAETIADDQLVELLHLKSLTQFQALHLNDCVQITDAGLQHLKSLTHLQTLVLNGCEKITDTGLQHLKSLTQLEQLYLTGCNQITDVGLRHLKSLVELRELVLFGCDQITDVGLRHLKSLTELETLYLTGCYRITDDGLLHLKSMTELQTLDLEKCEQVTDDGLVHLKSMTELQILYLDQCELITDVGLQHLKSLKQLQTLFLTGCDRITDAGLRHLKTLKQLQTLNLTGCDQITDAGLQHLKSLKQLQTLFLTGCEQITDVGIQYLKSLNELKTLDLENCARITDAGLQHLMSLTQLDTLKLSGCTQISDTGIKLLQTEKPELSIYSISGGKDDSDVIIVDDESDNVIIVDEVKF